MCNIIENILIIIVICFKILWNVSYVSVNNIFLYLISVSSVYKLDLAPETYIYILTQTLHTLL